MRFHVIMWKTLGDLMNLKRVVLLVVIGASLPLIILGPVLRSNFEKEPMSVEMQTQYLLDYFTILLFVWVAGFFLALAVATTAAGFISKEHDEGTLLILVSKPINRFEIILGKFLALVISSMLLQGIILCLCVLVFWAILSLDPYTVRAVLSLLPWAFLYSVLVILVFGSIAVTLSTVMRSRTKIMLVLMVLVMLVFFVGIIPRTMFAGTYESYYLYYPDLGYHLGNAFVLLLDQSGSWEVMPMNQVMLAAFTGTYEFSEDSFDPDINAWPSSLEMTNYVQPMISVLIWIAVCMGSIALSAVAIKRKEVY